MSMTFDEWKKTKDGGRLLHYQIHPNIEDDYREVYMFGQQNCNCVHTDNTEVISNLESKVKKLEAQIEKMKHCENCKYYTKRG